MGAGIRYPLAQAHDPQDEINYILDEYSALPPQQFIQACLSSGE